MRVEFQEVEANLLQLILPLQIRPRAVEVVVEVVGLIPVLPYLYWIHCQYFVQVLQIFDYSHSSRGGFSWNFYKALENKTMPNKLIVA